MNLDLRLLRYLRYTRTPLIRSILSAFLAGLAVIAQAWLLSRVVAGVFLEGQTLAQVTPLLALLLAAVVMRAGLGYLSETAASITAAQVKQRLRETLSHHLMDLGPAYVQGERSGELSNTLTGGVEAVDAYFSQYLPQLALVGLLPLAYLVMIFPLDPLSAAILLLTGPLIPFFMFLIGSQSHRLTGLQWSALSQMSAYFLDTIQGLKTLKALGRSEEQAGRIEQVSERYRLVTMQVLRVTFLSALALELLGTLGTAIIAVETGLRLLYGRLDFQSAFFILLLAPEFYQPLRSLGLRFHASMTGATAARRIFEVLETPLPDHVTAHLAMTERGVAGNRPVLVQPLAVDIEDVSFTYAGRGKAALQDVTLRLLPGQVTALVGPSGSGKSTLAHLLLGFLLPDRGGIRVNGLPVTALPLEAWRAMTAWVPQQPHLFHGTIADNLRVARPKASLVEMRHAVEQADLAEFVDGLPQGFDTPVGEGGARLSSGQAQRLALARAFLRDAPLLILDEPTAHLDVLQESVLRRSTARLCEGRTALVIAHRLATIAQAGQIVVLEHGQVVESGAPEQLLARDGAYARLLRTYRGMEGVG